jgi:tight adherence protein C
MTFAFLTFLAVFLMFGTGGALLFYREAMIKRIRDAINPKTKEKPKNLTAVIKQTGFSVGQIVERFEHMLPKSEQEISVATQRLTRAGYRDEQAVRIFYGSKVVCPIVLCAVVWISGLGSMGSFFIYVMALGVGFLGPDFWLTRKIKQRQKRITRGLPDVLDLLVICMEAGLSLDQATARAAQELGTSQPEICDELNIVVLEQRAGRARSEAWKRMSERTGVESLKNLVSMLVQTEQFGTSVAKMLRVHSDTLRTQRVQMIEELAAKTSVKLVFPLVLFIFPALFLVTLGPAAIVMMDSFGTLTGGH